MVKTFSGLTLGAGLMNLSFREQVPQKRTIVKKINVKISPPGPKSLALLEDVKKYIGRSNYTGLYGVGIKSGDGIYIEDMDGNTYIDCLTSASSTILGYGYDAVAKAYYDSAVNIQQTAFGYSANVETVDFAKKLIEITPGNFEKRVLIGLSGSDSMGGSIEAARKYTGKMGIISFNFAYHGSTGLSQPASGFMALNQGIYDLNDPDFVKVRFPVTREESLSTLKNIESILGFGKTAAVLVEMIQGDGGTLIPAPGFFKSLKELLDKYQVLLVDDEVQCGMGRTGKWWACEHEGVIPDILVAGKGLSAGYAPVSAIVGRKDVLDAMVPATQIFTYTGHGPSLMAASKVIDIILDENLTANSRDMGSYLLTGIKEAEKYPGIVVEARGKGFMIGIEINISKDLLASKIFAYRCLEKGIYFGYIGDKQRVIRVLPPLITSREECDEIIRVVKDTAEEMHNKKVPQTTIDKVQKYALGW